jgi:peroxiredoxin
MPRVSLQTPAPDFSLQDYRGQTVRLSDFKDQSNVLLVFNRTFS